MRASHVRLIYAVLVATVLLATVFALPQAVLSQETPADPLPSWNDGAVKTAIRDFVARVTKDGSPDFVPPAERIATFDNDGTLWCEQPNYVQAVFVKDRVKALADRHPEWKTKEPFRSVLDGDLKGLAATGEQGIAELVMATHAGMATEQFERIVSDWLAGARHPRFRRPYTELTYQPMWELLVFLRANGFTTFIVSGGGVEFMRPWTQRAYGVPPQQVVGSSIRTKYELQGGQPVLMRLPQIDFIDDRAGKPVGIGKFIGRRPIAAFGNSDGDFEMLEWTTSGPGARFGLIVHHTDAVREYAYDRDSHVGRLAKALDEAPKRGWIVVDMKNEWKTIFRNSLIGASGADSQ